MNVTLHVADSSPDTRDEHQRLMIFPNDAAPLSSTTSGDLSDQVLQYSPSASLVEFMF